MLALQELSQAEVGLGIVRVNPEHFPQMVDRAARVAAFVQGFRELCLGFDTFGTNLQRLAEAGLGAPPFTAAAPKASQFEVSHGIRWLNLNRTKIVFRGFIKSAAPVERIGQIQEICGVGGVCGNGFSDGPNRLIGPLVLLGQRVQEPGDIGLLCDCGARAVVRSQAAWFPGRHVRGVRQRRCRCA